MIISDRHRFVFIKGRKVAGTSVEVGLSQICGPDDVLTPITPADEQVRYQTTGRLAQNFGAKLSQLKSFHEAITTTPSDVIGQKKIPIPQGSYRGHMPLKQIERVHGIFASSYQIIAISRSPYEQVLSRIKHRVSIEAIRQGVSSQIDPDHPSFTKAKADVMERIATQKLHLNINMYKHKSGSYAITRILRHEHLGDDFKDLMHDLGCKDFQPLPHLKKTTTRRNIDLRQMFTTSELESIHHYFSEEFTQFNYPTLNI